MTDIDEPSNEDFFTEFIERTQRERRLFEQRQRRGRRVAFTFLPFSVGGGVLFGWAATQVEDRQTVTVLYIGFLLAMMGAWGMPYYQEYLNRKQANTEDDVQ